ncbi:adenosine deaminase-like [Anneissia japonica]|uniref:adenosine deaminase-like n=1 Tax=Anneissia japonica TaxID=1529436 RepID=UPI0014258255|nr:adenosine deaminase-like [Anneissia japonica]
MIKTLDIQSMEKFISKLRVTSSGSLPKFIRSFDIFLPILRGDRQAIKRIAIELCEDKANEGVAYFEASYCPHLLADNDVGVSVEEVVRNVNEGFSEGYKKFGVKANSILCMLITKPEWCADVVRLCDTYRHLGVVGIGLAGNENEPLGKEYFDNMKVGKIYQPSISQSASCGPMPSGADGGIIQIVLRKIILLGLVPVRSGMRVQFPGT